MSEINCFKYECEEMPIKLPDPKVYMKMNVYTYVMYVV